MRDLDLNIVCFLWHGDRWSEDDDGHEYVNRLYRSVQRNLTIPHNFICLTNMPDGLEDGIIIRPLHAPSWKGCLPKVCMFDPLLGLRGQVLSLDIDVVITGSLDELAGYRGNFAVRSSFADPRLLDGDIVGFKVGYRTNAVWNPLKLDPKKVEHITGGRERYWYRHVFGNDMDKWQELYPGQLLSYKRHIRRTGVLPEDARIVSCHGRPRPHEIDEEWAINNWR